MAVSFVTMNIDILFGGSCSSFAHRGRNEGLVESANVTLWWGARPDLIWSTLGKGFSFLSRTPACAERGDRDHVLSNVAAVNLRNTLSQPPAASLSAVRRLSLIRSSRCCDLARKFCKPVCQLGLLTQHVFVYKSALPQCKSIYERFFFIFLIIKTLIILPLPNKI